MHKSTCSAGTHTPEAQAQGALYPLWRRHFSNFWVRLLGGSGARRGLRTSEHWNRVSQNETDTVSAHLQDTGAVHTLILIQHVWRYRRVSGLPDGLAYAMPVLSAFTGQLHMHMLGREASSTSETEPEMLL